MQFIYLSGASGNDVFSSGKKSHIMKSIMIYDGPKSSPEKTKEVGDMMEETYVVFLCLRHLENIIKRQAFCL